MGTKIIIFLGVGSILFTWVILSIAVFSDDQSIPISENPSVGQSSVIAQQAITPTSIATWNGDTFSAVQLLESNDTEQITDDGLFKNTAIDDSYAIYYFEPNGNLTVQLFQEPLSLSRSFAEQQLRSVFKFSDEELCDLRIDVVTHEMVSREYSRANLGLSFCPNSVVLP